MNSVFASIEADPTGLTPHTPGAKLDSGKNRLGMVLGAFALALQEVGKVGTSDAAKYSDKGWLAVANGEERYLDAELRHIFKRAMGERVDADSGLLHAAHSAWNALVVLEFELRRQKEQK